MNLAIVIPAFNCAATVGETLNSLQNISRGWGCVSNVLVCDDGSSDNTAQIVQSFPFNRCPLTLVRHDDNRGEAVCYQTMVRALPNNLDWFLILHSDDVALDCFLERNLEILRQCDSRVAAVSSNYYVFDGYTDKLGHSPVEDRIVFRGSAHDEISHTAAEGCWWHISGSLINKQLWQQFGGRDPGLPQVGDWDLILRWQQAGYRVGHSLIPTTKHRIHQAASVSSRSYLEFRDLRERTRVILNSPDIFTPSITRKHARRFVANSIRRICKLVLNGKLRYAMKGLWTICNCLISLARQCDFPALEWALAVSYRCRMHKRWLAEFGVPALFNRLRFRGTRDLALVRLASKRFGPMVVRNCAEDFAVINTVIAFNAYCLPAKQHFCSVLDLGGNIGITTRYFLQSLSNVAVLAVEPSSANCEVFKRNIRLCDAADRVRLLQCAVGPVNSTGVLSAAKRFDMFKVEKPSDFSFSEGQEVVPVRSLSGLVKQLPAPILLKMDIEGAETDLLNCRTEWIDHVGCMMIEFHDVTQEKKWLKVLAEEGWKVEKHFDTWHFSTG